MHPPFPSAREATAAASAHRPPRRHQPNHNRAAAPCFPRARDGDPRAIRAVVDILRPRVTRMSAHYARRCGEEPEDLLQEAWLGVLEALPRLDTAVGQPDQYLLVHARWRVLDAIKRAFARRCLPLEDAVADALPARDAAPVATPWPKEFARSLKDTQRAILGCLLEGMTWREAGEALGCTSANVAYHVRQIRRRYEEWDPAEPGL
jgi:RNA polymerase sigma factor (sigma-70 family)